MSRLTTDYLAQFDRALNFDPGLARRVRVEVEAHLCDAIEAAGKGEEAERFAIARFGNPAALARDYALATLPRQIRTTWSAAIAMMVATFVFMRLRAILLSVPATADGASALLALADRAGFGAGIFFSLYAWHSARRRKGESVRNVLSPMCGATAAFLLSTLASLSRAATTAGPGPLVWITGSLEMMMIGFVCIQIRRLQHHAGLAAAPAIG
jgi:hypothetical protein